VTATSFELASSSGSTRVPLRTIRSASAIWLCGSAVGLRETAHVVVKSADRLLELAGCEGFEDLPMLAMQSAQASRSQTLRDLSLQPHVVDQRLQPTQHLVATDATQRGLERKVEARLLDVIGELVLPLVERTAEQAEVGRGTPLERGPEHGELDGDPRRQH